MQLSNAAWQAEVAPLWNGRVSRLADQSSGLACVKSEVPASGEIGEGGHLPFFGLECWVKTGSEEDFNTGVRSAFASIHGRPLTVIPSAPGTVRMEAKHAGLRYELTWGLPAGDQPLCCEVALTNESAPAAEYQFEFFFRWNAPEEQASPAAFVMPGMPIRWRKPYGETTFEASPHAQGSAVWWISGTTHGAALQGVTGIVKYFYGIQTPNLYLGAHSEVRSLAPGQVLRAVLAITPVAQALRQGIIAPMAELESKVHLAQQGLDRLGATLGELGTWVRSCAEPVIARRGVHLTFQYAAIEFDRVADLLERVLAPAGYNFLVAEIGRAFPYRTHRAIAPDWAWDRATWQRFRRLVEGLGMELIPQYNALGHQGESGMAQAYPELREDPNGWCLNPRHPRTLPYLADVIGELLDLFEPRVFSIGLDEVDMPSRPQAFCVSKECRGQDGGIIFGEFINRLHEILKARKVTTLMWADMLMYKPEHNSLNGLRTGTWRAIDRLPRDIVMGDWVYSPVKGYGGSDYLQAKGFRVMGCTWHRTQAVYEFTRFAAAHDFYGMLATTWCAPNIRDVPLACLLMGARCFYNPHTGTFEQLDREAEAMAWKLARHDHARGQAEAVSLLSTA